MKLLRGTSLKQVLLAPRTMNLYLLIVITAIGTILRFYGLGALGLGNDEASSVLDAQGKLYNISHPPLSYVILRIVIETLGTNEFTIRLPSCLFGIVTIPLAYLFGKQLFGEKEGLLASFIISLSPWYVRWSQDARMYTELTVFTMFALYFFYRATYQEKITPYVLSAIFALFAFYTHYSALLILVIVAVWLISKSFSENTKSNIDYKHLMIFFGLFLILILPLFFTIIPQTLAFKFGENTSRWGTSITDFLLFVFRYALGPVLSLFSISGAMYLILQKKSTGYLLTAYAAIPVLAFAVLAFQISVATRYVLFTLPAYALLASSLVIELFEKIRKSEIEKGLRLTLLKNLNLNTFLAFTFLFIVAIRINSLSALYQYYSQEDSGWKSACSYVAATMESEDLIATTGDKVVNFYLGKVDFNLSVELYEPSVFEEIKNSDERVWLLVTDRLSRIDPDHELRDWLDSDCEKKKEVNDVTVYLFTPPNQ